MQLKPHLPVATRKTYQYRQKIVTWIAVFAVAVLSAGFGVYWYQNLQTYHFNAVQPGVLYRAGNRDMREFKHALKFSGANTVVSLIDDSELHDPTKPQFLEETNFCTGNLIQYIRLPVPLGGWPTSDELKTFISIASNPANQPVLVHCAQGVRRTGMFVAAYEESVLHQSPEQVKRQVLLFGHRADDLADVKKFIDVYQPDKMTLPATFNAEVRMMNAE